MNSAAPRSGELREVGEAGDNPAFGSWALRWPVFALTTPASLVGLLILAPLVTAWEPGRLLAVAAAAVLTSWCVFAAAATLTARGAKQPLLIAAAWAASAATTPLSFFALLALGGSFHPNAFPAQFVALSVVLAVGAAVAFAVSSNFINSAAQYSIASHRWLLTSEKLRKVSHHGRDRVRKYRREIVQALTTQILNPLRDLQRQVRALDLHAAQRRNIEQLSAQCVNLARGRVRELSRTPAPLETSESPPTPARLHPSQVSGAFVAHIPLTSVGVLVTIFRLVPEIAHAAGVFDVLARTTAVLAWVITWGLVTNRACRSTTKPKTLPLKVALRATSLLVLWVGTAGLLAASVTWWPPNFQGLRSDPFAAVFPWAGATWVVAIVIVLTLANGWVGFYRDAACRTAAANKRVENQVRQVENELTAIQQELFEVLHGPVQSRLVAAGLLLREVASGNQDPAVLARVEEQLSNAAQSVTGLGNDTRDGSSEILLSGVHKVRSTWLGLLNVDVDVDTRAETTCAQHPWIAREVVTALTEVCTNSVHHGAASQVRIHISVSATSELYLEATDNGVGGADFQLARPASTAVWTLSPLPEGGTKTLVKWPAAAIARS